MVHLVSSLRHGAACFGPSVICRCSSGMSAPGLAAAAAELPAANTTGAVTVLATVCADFLGVALEACAVAGHTTTDQAAPTITIRLTEAAGGADGARVVRCMSVDVLGDTARVASLPSATPELTRLLTKGACAREWATRLWHAGVTLLHVRVISPSASRIDNWSYAVADEDSGGAAPRSWSLPLQQTESTLLSEELRGKSGFQVQLELCSADKPLPCCVSLERLLSALVRSSMLLAPAADLELEVERASCTPVLLEVPIHAELPPPTAVLVSVRSSSGAASTLERLKQAAASHLAVEQRATGPTSDVATQAVGFAQLKTGAHGKRVTWTATAVIASSSASHEPGTERVPTDAPGGIGIERPEEAPTRQAFVYCFSNSVLQMRPPPALLDVLSAKSTTAAVKAFGLQLCSCKASAELAALDDSPAPQFAPCATLVFSECDSLAVPALITLHCSCLMPQPLSSAAKLPKLGRKREAALIKAALLAALRDFKSATGGGTSFERGLRIHGFSALAIAVAKLATAGGEELQACAAALADRLSDVGPPLSPIAAAAPVDDLDQPHLDAPPSPERAQAVTLEQAVVAALLRVLAGNPPSDPPEPEVDEPAVASVGGSLDPSSREHPRDEPPADDEDVFPQRRRMRSPSPARDEAQESELPAEIESDDGWLL